MRTLFFYFILLLPNSFCAAYNELFLGGYFNPYILLKPVIFVINPLSCDTDRECQLFIKDSICNAKKTCACPDKKFLSSDETRCLSEVKEFGSSCEDNIQCSKLLSSGGSCIDNICKCKTGYHYLKGYCWKNFGLNEPCNKHEQCYSDYEYIGLECKEKVCKCRENYYERLGKSCRRAQKNGAKCNLNEDCREPNSKCESQTCTGVKYNEKNDIWVYNNYSQKTEQLTDEGYPKGIFEVNGERRLELGMECSQNQECNHISNAICLDSKVCGCSPPLYVAGENNRECLKVTRGLVDDLRQSSCKKDPQCNVFGDNSYCLDKKCACKNGSYWENNSKYCWPIKSLGESCSENKDCHPKERHAVCNIKEKICICEKGYHEKNGNCEPDAMKVGDHCEVDKDCLFDNSYCDEESEKCVCKEHYNVVNGQCVAGIESTCANDADCAHLKNTHCVRGNTSVTQCLCINNYIKSEDNTYCLPSSGYGENCVQSFQCKFNLGELAECKNGICVCNSTAHFSLGKCYKSKFLGESCAKKLDCFPGDDSNSVICLRGFCSCNYNYKPMNKRFCLFANSATNMKLYSVLLMVFPLVLELSN